MNYNEQNAHPRDKEPHLSRRRSYLPLPRSPAATVTSLVESCFDQFDVDYWAPRKAEQLGISETELRRRWEEKGQRARDLGTAMHANIEKYYLGEPFEEFDTQQLFCTFEAHNSLRPYRSEWAVYDEDLGVAVRLTFWNVATGSFAFSIGNGRTS